MRITPRVRLGGYSEWAPPSDLEDVVEGSWTYACSSVRTEAAPSGGSPVETCHRVIPHTGVSLVLKARRTSRRLRPRALSVMGSAVTHRFFEPSPEEVLVAVRLRAEWCRAVLGFDAEELLDRIVPVETPRWRRIYALLAEVDHAAEALRCLHDLVRDRRGEIRSASSAILAHGALESIRHRPSDAWVWRVARDEGVSERSLRRAVGAATGLGPKRIQRIERLNRAVLASDGLERPGWSSLAYRFGFSDQAHLTREVRSLTGCTPVELHRERRTQNRWLRPPGSRSSVEP